VFGGTDSTAALFMTSKALLVSETQLICVDIPVYTNALLPVAMYVDFHLSYNLQEFWGRKRIMYYQVTTISSLDYYKFVPSRHMTLKVDGINFVNTADSLLCKLSRDDRSLYSTHVHFVSPSQIICTFEYINRLHQGDHIFSVTFNGGVQFSVHGTPLQIMAPVFILNVMPKVILT
jgi:hypothetical protein